MRDGEAGMVDRCDGCCARARTWWALINDTHDRDRELYLCRHHGNQHQDRLVATGWVLVADEAPTPGRHDPGRRQ